MRHRFDPGIRALLAAVTLMAAGVAGSGTTAADSTPLIESTGLDALMRADSRVDAALVSELPEFLPPELRSEISGVITRITGYAEMRRALAQEVSSRLDSAAIDRHSRWWSSSTGKAIATAHVVVFDGVHHAAEQARGRRPIQVHQPLATESPFVTRLPRIVYTSRSTSECLRMLVGFRRSCPVEALTAPSPGVDDGNSAAVDAMLAVYSKLSEADVAAFRAYLKTPGATESLELLADAYLKTRASKLEQARSAVDEALARFARAKIGTDSEATLRTVISLVDENESLEEANLILHLLRGVSPRDPRVFVELARVSIKLAPFVSQPMDSGWPPQLDPSYLDDAQSWMDRAMAIDAKRADTLVLAGHLAYLKSEQARSIALLEQAARIGTNNPWLRLNMADALWASALEKDYDKALLGRAADQLKAALARNLPPRMQWQAAHSLAHVYEDLRDYASARSQFQQLISLSEGRSKAEATEEYARFLFLKAGDVDAAIATARQARNLNAFDGGSSLLAHALLVKAGTLYSAGQAPGAKRLVDEARSLTPQVVRNYSRLARLPRTFPAVLALRESGAIDLKDSEGGQALFFACSYAGAGDIERLIKGGADPNYLVPDEGTPLYAALRARNLAALRVLLAHGADVSIRVPNNQLPIEYAESVMDRPDAKEAEILAMLRAAAKGHPAAEPVGGPLKTGYEYQALRYINRDPWGYEVKEGTRLTFTGTCNYSNPKLACLKFKNPGGPGYIDVALDKSELVSWHLYFKELGPERPAAR